MKTIRLKNLADLKSLSARFDQRPRVDAGREAKVRRILQAVQRGGDKALLAFARKFDGARLKAADLRVPASEIKAAYGRVDRPLVTALARARTSIAAYQERLLRSSWRRHVRPGVLLGQLVRPLRRVGLCVPGGEAPLVSTVLMTAVPAKVAGVPELVMVTPSRHGNGVDPRLLVAADIAGVTEVYQVGGAQAVAALAYGTQSIPAVDKIVGPGSAWVSLAKKLVYGQVGIDMVAGPSEILIVADDSADPRFLAADLLSQAEHAGEESAVLVTPSEKLAKRVKAEVAAQAARLERRKAVDSSLRRFGLIILVKDLDLALEVANAKAPEHLELALRHAESYLPRVQHAGAIFLGSHTPEALGDYLAGPSHVLPTGGTARFSSGLSVEDFVKKSSIIGYSREALESSAQDVVRLAGAEGLTAHAASVKVRQN
jgi:histidinol dehydrogenase